MKRELVSAGDITTAASQGLDELYITKDALITPQAKDQAARLGIRLCRANDFCAANEKAGGGAARQQEGYAEKTTGNACPAAEKNNPTAPLPDLPYLRKKHAKAKDAVAPVLSAAPKRLDLPYLRKEQAKANVAVAAAPLHANENARQKNIAEALMARLQEQLPPHAKNNTELDAALRKAVDDTLQGIAANGEDYGGISQKRPTAADAYAPCLPGCPPHCPCKSGAPEEEDAAFLQNNLLSARVKAVSASGLQWEKLHGEAGGKVNIIDVITQRDGSPMGGGYLEWNALSFPWRLTYAEIDVVLEGELHITSGGETVVGKAGDMLFIPKDTDVVFSSPGYVKFAYVTWPADWSSLLEKDSGR